LPYVAFVCSLPCITLFLFVVHLALLQVAPHVVIGGYSPCVVACSYFVSLLFTLALHCCYLPLVVVICLMLLLFTLGWVVVIHLVLLLFNLGYYCLPYVATTHSCTQLTLLCVVVVGSSPCVVVAICWGIVLPSPPPIVMFRLELGM